MVTYPGSRACPRPHGTRTSSAGPSIVPIQCEGSGSRRLSPVDPAAKLLRSEAFAEAYPNALERIAEATA
jgi:hypothetical protein